MSDAKPEIGIGLVGTGFMAKAHTNAFSTVGYMFPALPCRARLAAVASESADRARAAAERYGFAKAVVGVDALLDDPEVVLVDVANADRLHAAAAVAALEKGKHVFCEKPMATCLADALVMRDAAAKSGRIAMCGFNYRFLPAVVLAKRLIDNGTMGRVYSFNGSYAQDVGAYEDTPHEKVWYAGGGPKASGVLYGIGSHIIDMARHLVGDIEFLSGRLRTHVPERGGAGGAKHVASEEDAVAVVDFANGALGSIRASAVAAGRKNRLAWEISCAKGTLAFDLEDLNYLSVFHRETPVKEVTGFTRVNVTQLDRDHPFMDVWWPRGHGLGWEHAHVNEMAHLLECIATGRPVNPEGATFEDGWRAVQAIEAIHRSDSSGARVRVDDV